jgi:oligopeptide/dipeptide ABC transporter ATP-binding protein
MTAPLLEIRDLTVEFGRGERRRRVLDRVSFSIEAGEHLGLVGESGSGKTVLALALMGLLRGSASAVSGTATFAGVDLLTASRSALTRLRGAHIGLIPQDASLALNPVLTVGDQILEVIAHHRHERGAPARNRAIEVLARVGLGDPERVLRAYPSALSGGMKQRVGIAIALCCDPEFLIADDPTSAVDVTIQAQILRELRGLTERTGVSVLFITHDLRVVATMCSRVIVLYAGQIAEIGAPKALLAGAHHHYARALVRCSPTVEARINPLPVVPGSNDDAEGSPDRCRFAPRCPGADETCRTQRPVLAELRGSDVACWHPLT